MNGARAGVGVTLLAVSGAAPEGLIEFRDLPTAPDVPLNARVRDGADQQLVTVVLESFRSGLADAALEHDRLLAD